MANEVRRTAIHSFEDPSHIGGQIVHGYAIERAAALSSTAHVNSDRLKTSGSEHARQVFELAGATAGIREHHDRSAGSIKGAFERRAADFDVSPLPQISLSRAWAVVRCPKRKMPKASRSGRITVPSRFAFWASGT